MALQCPVCHGTGFEFRSRDDGVATAQRCRCERGERSEHLLRQARIPRRYDHCSFETFEEGHDPSLAAALRSARAYVEQWPARAPGLIFLGRPGTGKTHLAVAIARELIGKGAQVVFYEQRELLKALQGTFDTASLQRETEILGPVLEAEVLVLDDLGAGRITPWARDVMHEVIAQRYNEVRPLIMTSNHLAGNEPETAQRRTQAIDEPLTLTQRLGDALMSRLYEMCEIVRLCGDDYRVGAVRHSRRG